MKLFLFVVLFLFVFRYFLNFVPDIKLLVAIYNGSYSRNRGVPKNSKTLKLFFKDELRIASSEKVSISLK